jgi:hypothetical protein
MHKPRKIRLGLLALAFCLLALGACTNNEDNTTDREQNLFGQLLAASPQDTVRVYFKDPNGPCLIPLDYTINPTRDTVWVALEKALAGPPNDFVDPIIPAGIKIVDVYSEDNMIQLFLQGEGDLSADDVDFTALSATVNTAIIAQNHPNNYPLQVYYNDMPLNPEPIQPAAINDYSEGSDTTMTVYYSDSQAMYAVPVELAANTTEPAELCREVVSAWLSEPPEDLNLSTAVPDGVKLLACELKDGQLTLDFDQTLVSYQGGTTRETMLLNTLLASCSQIETINSLQILIEGQIVEYLPEGSSINLPFDLSGQNPPNLLP